MGVCLNWDSWDWMGDLWDFVVADDVGLRWVALLVVWVPRPFVRPGHPHPGPLPLSGRGDVFLVGDGFSWRKRLWGECVVGGCGV